MHYENQKTKQNKKPETKQNKNTSMCCKDKTLKASIVESNQGYEFNDGF